MNLTIVKSAARRYWPLPKSFFEYGSVSVLTALVELAVLHTLLGLHLRAPIAVSAAYLTSSLFQFCVLRYVVFKVAHKPVLLQVNTYVIAAILSWWAVLGAVTLLTTLLPLTTMEARLISIPVLFPVNYLLSRYVIFRR